LPLAIVALCAGGALLTLSWDGPIPGWLYHGDVQDAAEFASALVGAMITVTTLSLSITMVVLTLAAQQLGPRLILIFMRSRLTQGAIGLLVGVSVYLLIVLRSLGRQGALSANLAVSLGAGLVLLSLIVLVIFVHALARSIVADHIIRMAGKSFDAALCATFSRDDSANDSPAGPAAKDWKAIILGEHGYVQRIQHHTLLSAAVKAGVQARLLVRRGEFLLPGEPALQVSGAPDSMHRAARRAISIAPDRTDNRDPEWTARQLVEIGLRALSAGINDPFTAIAVIDRLSRSIALLHGRPDPPTAWADEKGQPRLYCEPVSFGQVIETAFLQLIEAGCAHVAVRTRLQNNLGRLQRRFCDEPARAAEIERQLRVLAELS